MVSEEVSLNAEGEFASPTVMSKVMKMRKLAVFMAVAALAICGVAIGLVASGMNNSSQIVLQYPVGSVTDYHHTMDITSGSDEIGMTQMYTIQQHTVSRDAATGDNTFFLKITEASDNNGNNYDAEETDVEEDEEEDFSIYHVLITQAADGEVDWNSVKSDIPADAENREMVLKFVISHMDGVSPRLGLNGKVMEKDINMNRFVEANYDVAPTGANSALVTRTITNVPRSVNEMEVPLAGVKTITVTDGQVESYTHKFASEMQLVEDKTMPITVNAHMRTGAKAQFNVHETATVIASMHSEEMMEIIHADFLELSEETEKYASQSITKPFYEEKGVHHTVRTTTPEEETKLSTMSEEEREAYLAEGQTRHLLAAGDGVTPDAPQRNKIGMTFYVGEFFNRDVNFPISFGTAPVSGPLATRGCKYEWRSGVTVGNINLLGSFGVSCTTGARPNPDPANDDDTEEVTTPSIIMWSFFPLTLNGQMGFRIGRESSVIGKYACHSQIALTCDTDELGYHGTVTSVAGAGTAVTSSGDRWRTPSFEGEITGFAEIYLQVYLTSGCRFRRKYKIGAEISGRVLSHSFVMSVYTDADYKNQWNQWVNLHSGGSGCKALHYRINPFSVWVGAIAEKCNRKRCRNCFGIFGSITSRLSWSKSYNWNVTAWLGTRDGTQVFPIFKTSACYHATYRFEWWYLWEATYDIWGSSPPSPAAPTCDCAPGQWACWFSCTY